jgi:PilZ domain
VTELDDNFDQDFFERRLAERRNCCHGALLRIAGLKEIFACSLRDVSERGASVRLRQEIPLLPTDFAISENNFQTARRCRLVWRETDFVGVEFSDPQGAIER